MQAVSTVKRAITFIQIFFFGRRHLPFGWSPDLRLTRGPAGNRTTTGSLSATQECRNTNWATRTPNYIHTDHTVRWLGHHIVAVAKSVSSKAYGLSPGPRQSCSNMTGRHRSSAICSNAVRAKLPVKSRSSVSKSYSTHHEVLYPQ